MTKIQIVCILLMTAYLCGYKEDGEQKLELGFNNMNKGADILLLIYNMSALLHDVCRNRLPNSPQII